MLTFSRLLLCFFISCSFYLSQCPLCHALLAGERVPIAFDTLLKGAFTSNRKENDLECTRLWNNLQLWLSGKDLQYPYARISYTIEGREGFPIHHEDLSRDSCKIGEDQEMIVPTAQSSDTAHGERLIIFTLPKADPGIACVSLEVVNRFHFCPIRKCAVKRDVKYSCGCCSEGIKKHTIQEEITHRFIVFRGPVSLALLFGQNNTSYRNSPMVVDTIDPKEKKKPLISLVMLEDQISVLKNHEFFMVPRAVSELHKQWDSEAAFTKALEGWKYPNHLYHYGRHVESKDWDTFERIKIGLAHYYSRELQAENLHYRVEVNFPFGKNISLTSSIPLKCDVKFKREDWAQNLKKDTLYYFCLFSRSRSPSPPDKNPAFPLGLSLPFVLAGSAKITELTQEQTYKPCDAQQFLNKFYDCRMTYLEAFQYPIIPISPTLIPVNAYLHDEIYVSFALPAQEIDDDPIDRSRHLAGIIYKKETSLGLPMRLKRINIFCFPASKSERPYYFAAAMIRLNQEMINEDYDEFQLEFVYMPEFAINLILQCERFDISKVFYKALLHQSVKGHKLVDSTIDYTLDLELDNPLGIHEFLAVASDEFQDYGPKINALYEFYKRGREMEKKYCLTKICFPASKFDVFLSHTFIPLGQQFAVRLTFLKNFSKALPIQKISIYLNSFATVKADEAGNLVPFVKKQLVQLKPPYSIKDNKLYIFMVIQLDQPTFLAYHMEHELEFEVITSDRVVSRGFSGLFRMIIRDQVSKRVYPFPLTDQEVLPFRITALPTGSEKFSDLQKEQAIASYKQYSLAGLLNVEELKHK